MRFSGLSRAAGRRGILWGQPRRVPASLSALNIKQAFQQLVLLTIGTGIAALGYSLFQVPHNIAAGGLGGISIIINHFTGWPVGTLYLVMNLPLLILGFFYLGRWRVVTQTMLAAVLFSVATNFFVVYLPQI